MFIVDKLLNFIVGKKKLHKKKSKGHNGQSYSILATFHLHALLHCSHPFFAGNSLFFA